MTDIDNITHTSYPDDARHMSDMTHFGFRDVATHLRQGLVNNVFDNVADYYDMMNDVMSAGLHRLWKQRMIDQLYLSARHNKDGTALTMADIAGGTGDIARRAAQRAQSLGLKLDITIIDINLAMLQAGRTNHTINMINGNAETMPLPDCSMDFYTIAFGIRNVTHRQQALKEAYRVLKPGGRFVCLEFSHPPARLIKRLYDSYAFNIIPFMGDKIAGQGDAYRYLVESIERFPTAEDFRIEIEQSGFHRTHYQRLSGGVAALHYGWRL